MKRFASRWIGQVGLLSILVSGIAASAASGLALAREQNWLVIRGDHLPAGQIRINYLEAYCRPDAHTNDWVKHTVIHHANELVSISSDARVMLLRDTLTDGVVVEHRIEAREDEIVFELVAHNKTKKRSEAHWAQPCVRLGDFTGFGEKVTRDDYAYLPKCFVFIDNKVTRLPMTPWATEARYTPGQVWRPASVPAADVNPRPLNPRIPSNGLIGCFSGDDRWIFATAWEPYHELFQGVARCLHSDFRLGGLQPGETKKVRGRIYIVANDVEKLLARYRRDFPEHVSQ